MVLLYLEIGKNEEFMGDSNYEITPDEESFAKKKKKLGRMRNLAQYKNMPDEEFEKLIQDKSAGVSLSEEFEKRIKAKIDEFDKDYDLSDLKANDWMTLRAMIQAILSLEEYEQTLFRMRSDGLSDEQTFRIQKLQSIMSELRGDISKFQNDLNITRKIRKSDQDVSVQAYIDKLKKDAKIFYENKMSYIFCPKCNMLLATIWTLYPEEEKNKIVLHCNRKLEDNKVCGEKVIITTAELLAKRGTNKRDITPESML